MKKHLVPIFLILFSPAFFLNAQEQGKSPRPQLPPPPGERFMPDHPMLAALESSDFTQEERVRLKKLSKDDPRKFALEMRKHFFATRQKKARNMLQLRQNYRNASTPEAKKDALKNVQNAIRKDMEDHLKMRKNWLVNTEKMVRQMEKRLTDMRKRYEKQLTEKDALIEKRTGELLADQPPLRLVRDAAGDFQRDRKPRKGFKH